jgi:hypothetical protein
VERKKIKISQIHFFKGKKMGSFFFSMRNMIIIISPHVSPEAAQPRMSISFWRIRKILLDAAENSKNGRYDQSTLPAPKSSDIPD